MAGVCYRYPRMSEYDRLPSTEPKLSIHGDRRRTCWGWSFVPVAVWISSPLIKGVPSNRWAAPSGRAHLLHPARARNRGHKICTQAPHSILRSFSVLARALSQSPSHVRGVVGRAQWVISLTNEQFRAEPCSRSAPVRLPLINPRSLSRGSETRRLLGRIGANDPYLRRITALKPDRALPKLGMSETVYGIRRLDATPIIFSTCCRIVSSANARRSSPSLIAAWISATSSDVASAPSAIRSAIRI
jgi:hypothetical protein